MYIQYGKYLDLSIHHAARCCIGYLYLNVAYTMNICIQAPGHYARIKPAINCYYCLSLARVRQTHASETSKVIPKLFFIYVCAKCSAIPLVFSKKS